MLSEITSLDERIFQRISHLPHPAPLRYLATFIHAITWGGIIYYPFIVYFATERSYFRFAALWFTTILITFLSTDVLLKNIFKRARPYEGRPNVRPLPLPPLSYSFPSGQSAAAAASATLLSLQFPTPLLQTAFIIGALVVCFDRIYTRHHYPADTIIGALLGALIGLVFFFLF